MKNTVSKFSFNTEIPAEIKTVLEKYLLAWEWLIPGWVQTVYIEWGDASSKDTETGAMCAQVDYAYRFVTLTFYPCWHTQTEKDKQQMVIHELLHAFSRVLADYAEDAIKRLLPEDEASKHREEVLKELENREESFVQDLSYCLQRHLGQKSSGQKH